ncbi:MAG: hypothetical protein IKK08_10565 [Clostridia bacterium]|nr:hypothetical protein [Clostridia bacterium]
MTLWDSVVDELFFGGREKKAMEQAALAAAEAEACAPVCELVPAKPMSAWDRAVDDIFFGGREQAALAAAQAEVSVPACGEDPEADADVCAAESEPIAEPVKPVPAAPAKPMSAWDRAVDDIFFGGREQAALAAAQAEASIPVCGEAPEADADVCATESEPVTEPVKAVPAAPAKTMSAWDRAVDDIFFGGREQAALAAAQAEAPIPVCGEAPEAEAAVCAAESEPAKEDSESPAEAQPAGEAEPKAYDFDAAKEKLMALQHKLQEAKIPMVIVLEGWQASGKGTLAGELLEGLDPRGYSVAVEGLYSDDEDLYPAMHRYWVNMPKQGMVSVFIGSWYHDLCAMLVKGKHPKRSARRLKQIRLMEQMLLRDGAVIEKFFIDVPAKVQKQRLKELHSRKMTRKALTKADFAQNKHYDKWQAAYRQVMEESAQPGAEWHLLSGEDKKAAKRTLYETVIASMEQAITLRQNGDRSWDTETLTDHKPIPTEPIATLETYETNLTLEGSYKEAVDTAQKKLHKLQYELFRKGIPVVIAFEGWDAAGKGGSIRRLTSALDPRCFDVVPIASPTAEEKAHHHLWRFWKALPKRGDITVFDRTWYGRVMVERLEGFCTEAQWKRAYEEMNLFERDLHRDGAVLCKFWLQISPEEQLKRFNSRSENPDKQWKITEEDWRNREKWSLYEEAVNDMLQKTNTAYAPWTVVEADSKQFARVKVLETVIAAIEKRLAEE